MRETIMNNNNNYYPNVRFKGFDKPWEQKQLSELSNRIIVGLATSVTPFYRSSGVPLLRNMNIKKNYLDDSDILYLDEEYANSNTSKMIHDGDVLTVHTGSNIGLSCIAPEKYENSLSFTTLITTPNSELLNNRFLSQYINSENGMNRIYSIITAGGKPNLNSGDLEKLIVSHSPDVREQELIGLLLEKIDDDFAFYKHKYEKLEMLKEGLLSEMFPSDEKNTPKIRLYGYNDSWKQAELWQLTTWDKKFNEVESYKQPRVIKYPYVLADVLNQIEDSSGDVRLLSTGSYTGFTTKEKAANNLCFGEIVAIPWGGVANVKYCKGYFVTADNRIATSNDKKVLSNRYLRWWMEKNIVKIQSTYRGASIQHPSMNDVLSLEIQYPSIDEQELIADCFDKLESMISLYEFKCEKLSRVKQALMNEMLV